MVTCNHLLDNPNLHVVEQLGNIRVLEYEKDLSVTPQTAMNSYFASQMDLRRRQVLIELQNDSYIIQAGAMQWTCGSVEASSGIKGVGDLLGKAIASKVTKESAVKPEYRGSGFLMLEPTYRHILLLDVGQWSGLVLDDGLFLAASGTVRQRVVARTNVSSAVLGKEGLFNLCLEGQGIVALESPTPRDELIEFELDNDVLRIDGNMAIAWSNSLNFSVEKSTKSLLGSAVSGEGFVNVYRGTGKVLMAPVE
ncbi:MAG: AIM24 family protein [Clostridiales bacterium]|nr:AIM24 family protein [Clostridiales bacterium]